MAARSEDEKLGIDAEQHPTSGRWRWIWTADSGAERIGLFVHPTEAQARADGRKFARKKLSEANNLRGRRR